ncbi:MAG TPA: symmetrical bis(5'-nucleosyl)-tetraphosphatase [Xanthomonadales bacterium]|nr:symmetrical bis(5'-nucleosyl)-tetraphosphatase [Xanthomonadales bacterium]
MATYAIGDVQGCCDALNRLLDKLKFDPARDRLWFCGDLVNRGGQSLETLRLVRSLEASSVAVLGNHDLSLCAIATRKADEQRRTNTDLQRVLFADDAPVLLDWLRSRPMFHHDAALGFAMVHAGLAPKWTIRIAARRAREVEKKLRGPNHRKLLRQMYGNKPAAWSTKLTGIDRLRAIINVMTRLRFCDARGRIAFDEKGAPGTQPQGLYPWFEVPGQAGRELPVICGHWSTLGLLIGLGVRALDTGAVWGGKLTALELGPELRIVQVPGPANTSRNGGD